MNGKRELLIAIAVLVVLLIGAYAVFASHPSEVAPAAIVPTATSTSTDAIATSTPSTGNPSTDVHAYGPVTLRLGETATFAGIQILPVAVIEDSRCPAGVQCIQAGRVRASVRVTVPGKTTSETLSTGATTTVGPYALTIASVSPTKTVGAAISPDDYRLTIQVTKPGIVSTAGKCYVGGCSAEVCSDQSGTVSSCIYRAQYACYKTATCERQASGTCGWTNTPALTQCLSQAS